MKIGTLGAARITPMALVRPARVVPGVEVSAIAARDPERAQRFARKHGIARVHPSYEDLIADEELDAIYNPLPNSLHCEWTVKALEAGKHVLCEKPFASNADEARRMADAARAADRVLVEAFHWRYHPLATRMKEIVGSGELGRVRHIESKMCVPLLVPGNIRYRWDLGGGAMMDLGCYTVNIIRFIAGAEPEVLRAEARRSSPNVDRWTRADMRFADGRSARLTVSLCSTTLLNVSLRVEGEEGEMRVLNPNAPHVFHRLSLRTRSGRTSERVAGEPTYVGQLRAFVAHVGGGERMSSDDEDAVRNMAVIDAVYDAAGMKRRGT